MGPLTRLAREKLLFLLFYYGFPGKPVLTCSTTLRVIYVFFFFLSFFLHCVFKPPFQLAQFPGKHTCVNRGKMPLIRRNQVLIGSTCEWARCMDTPPTTTHPSPPPAGVFWLLYIEDSLVLSAVFV